MQRRKKGMTPSPNSRSSSAANYSMDFIGEPGRDHIEMHLYLLICISCGRTGASGCGGDRCDSQAWGGRSGEAARLKERSAASRGLRSHLCHPPEHHLPMHVNSYEAPRLAPDDPGYPGGVARLGRRARVSCIAHRSPIAGKLAGKFSSRLPVLLWSVGLASAPRGRPAQAGEGARQPI